MRFFKLRKHVNASLVITATLSATSGVTGTAFNLVIVTTEGGKPDTTDAPSVLVTAPDGTTTTQTGTPDPIGATTIAEVAGTQIGAYTYAVTVAGEAGPTLTFNRS